jgi:hypothetical protein
MKKLSKQTLRAIADAANLLEHDLSEAQDYADEKSDKWRESDAGAEYQGWIEDLENLFDAMENVRESATE